MVDGSGWLEINGERCEIRSAQCDLFAGELTVGATCYRADRPVFDFHLLNLPCEDAVEYSALRGMHVRCDKRADVLFTVDCADSKVEALDCKIDYDSSTHRLAMNLSLSGYEWDIIDDMVPRQFELSSQVLASCEVPAGETAISFPRPIPPRFANFYLSRLGVPAVSPAPSRDEVIARFGPPIRTAENPGGTHPTSGFTIPDWTIHRFSDFELRWAFSGNVVTHVTVLGLDP